MDINSFGSRLLGWEPPIPVEVQVGVCEGPGQALPWASTKSAVAGIQHLDVAKAFTPKAVTLINGDVCTVGDWIVWVQFTAQSQISRIGQVVEIVQHVGSAAQREGVADFILVSRTIVGEPHDIYKMRHLQIIPGEYLPVQIKVTFLCPSPIT